MKIRKNLVRMSDWLVTAIALALATARSVQAAEAALVFQTDFSLKDGAVSAKKFGIGSGPGWSLEIRFKGKGSP